jgi:hypothetical protein
MKKLIIMAMVMICMVMVAQAQDTIPKGFKGDDIVAVVKALNSGSTHLPEKHKFIFTGPRDILEKVYTFKLADDQVLSSPAGVWVEKTTKGIRVKPNSVVIPKPGERPVVIREKSAHYLIKDMGKENKNWAGQNVFGARTRVETEKETKYFINVKHDIGKLPVKPEGGKIGVLFIGKPTDFGDPWGGYVNFPGQSCLATFDMPYETVRKYYAVKLDLQEVMVYDQNSGKVLLKYKP